MHRCSAICVSAFKALTANVKGSVGSVIEVSLKNIKGKPKPHKTDKQ